MNGLQIEGRQQRSQADKVATIINTVDLNYFETAGVAVESGREFTNVDQEGSTPVAMVNEKLARDNWPNGDARGKGIRWWRCGKGEIALRSTQARMPVPQQCDSHLNHRRPNRQG